MKIEDIMKEWSVDCQFDENNPSGETVRAAKLHSKWMNFLVHESIQYQRICAEVKKLKLAKAEYYNGTLSQEELKEYGWKPCPKKILKTDIPTYIEADQDVIDMSLKSGLAKQKYEFIEDVIKQINKRGYDLRVIVDWARFKNGG